MTEATQKLYPGASFDKAKQLLVKGKPAFDIDFKNGKLKLYAVLSTDGTVIERRDEITADALNPDIQIFLRKNHPNTKVRKARHLTQNGKKFFKVNFRSKAGGKIKLRVEAKGQPLEDPETN